MREHDLTAVAKHNLEDDMWFVIDGKIYDVTKFHDMHPGGEVFLPYAGTDCTDIFYGLHRHEVILFD